MTNGGAGPSGTDSDFFQHIIMNKNFKGDGEKLRTELAKYARQICSEYLHPALIMPYLNSRLIPLNKCPGIRPIGIGETVRRIVGKAVAWTMKQDIQGVAGPLQVCTGLKSGAEAAVHFIREKFREETAQACILVDASNAFNSVNRQVMLHNIQRQLPELAPVAINMYRNESRLFVSGTAITSSEGTTQGDNLAMSLFALATLPILQHLERLTIAWQVWLADDATAVGTLARLQHWWRLIVEEGKKYGYHVNATKSCLVLKNSEDLSVAQELFGPSGIRISSEGQRHLGSVIGSADFTASYIEGLVNEWESMINNLSVFARTQPHAAYCAFTHGVRHKITYFMRTIEGLGKYLQRIDKLIDEKLIPALYGCKITPFERRVSALPVRYGGIGLPILSHIAAEEFEVSLKVTRGLISRMTGTTLDEPEDMRSTMATVHTTKDEKYEAEYNSLLNLRRVTQSSPEC